MEEEDINRAFSRDDKQTMGMEEDQSTSHDDTVDPDEQALDPSQDIPPNPNRDMEEDESTPLDDSVDSDEEQTLDPSQGGKLTSGMRVRRGYVFPDEFDKEGCEGCPECSGVFKELSEFEKRLRLRKKEIDERAHVQIDVENKITLLYSSLDWRCNLLMYLYSILKEAKTRKGEELETKWKDEKSRWNKETVETQKRISASLKRVGLPNDDIDGYDEIKDRFYPVAVLAKSGTCLYMHTKLEELAYPLIKDILDEANGKPIDEVAVIKSQIELAKKLPINEVEDEIGSLLHEITFLHGHEMDYDKLTDLVMGISDVIEDTSHYMMKLARGIGETRHKGDKGEKCSVKDTLISLFGKAKIFEQRWNEEYATYLGDFGDVTNPKRQRTMEAL